MFCDGPDSEALPPAVRFHQRGVSLTRRRDPDRLLDEMYFLYYEETDFCLRVP